jgi:hypothetical protein
MKDRRVKKVFSWGWVPVGEGEEHKERVNMYEYDGCILYSYMNIKE